MKTVKDVFGFLNMLAPVELKMDFDNVGILVGSEKCKVEKCLVALDITDEVIDEAINLKANLIVSHHPLIFHELKNVVAEDLVGRKLIKLIKNNISAICMHTNLDIAQDGVNDALMSALGATASGFLEPCGMDTASKPVGCGRIGELSESVDFRSFLSICKRSLNTNGLKYYDSGQTVKKLAVMGGSGGDCIALAKSLGCDTYVTADIKYNGFLDAKELGINLVDADHFCTENVIIPILREKLAAEFEGIEFLVSEVHCQTAQFY